MNIKILLLIILLLPMGFSAYYADIEIDVSETGEVSISGATNYEEFKEVYKSQEYTSKEKSYWILEINSNETFEEFIFQVLLPEGSTINYLKSTPTIRIEEENNRIKLIGTGENRELSILIQYTIDNNTTQKKENPLKIPILLLSTLALISSLLIIKLRKKKNKSIVKEELKKEIDISILPERQQEIIKILKDKGKITQKELELTMEIPKSSVSRNVRTLEIKEYIIKNQVGQTNYLSLNKEFFN